MTSVERKKYDELLAEFKGDEDKADLHFIRWKCVTDLYFLGTEILGLARQKKRVYPPFHRWLCSVLQSDDDQMVMVPRKHAKTTWVEAWVVQLILKFEGRVRILMLSRTERIVTWSLASIKRHLAKDLLRRYFPEIIPEPLKDYKGWQKSTSNELRMRDYDGWNAKESQIMALGSAASFTGSAVDVIVMDDYVDEKTCASVTLMQKAEEDWRYLQSIIDLGGIFRIVGTFYHYNDLYNLMIKERHFKKEQVHVRRAIENGKILYPTIFSQKLLDQIKRREGNYIFSCQYLLDPIPKEDQIFPGPQPTCVEIPQDKYRYFIMMDPAATTKGYSDKTGFVVAAVNKLKQIFYVEAFSFKKDGAGKAAVLIQKCLQYNPERVGIEYGLQIDLDYILKHKKAEYEKVHQVRVPMNIYPIKVTNKQSKADRIYLTLGAFVRDRQVMIKESGCRELVQQMDVFTGKGNEDDNVVDAASMLFPLAEDFAYPKTMFERMPMGENSFFNIFKKRPNNSWRSNFNGYDRAV